jgi:hypothetical protein
VSGDRKDPERVQPCFNQRRVRQPAVNATLRMSLQPSYASIRGWLIAEGVLRKDRKQGELWKSLKILKSKLHWIASGMIGEQAYAQREKRRES